MDAYPFITLDENLTLTTEFGNEPNGFTVNKNKQTFLDDINIQILKMRFDLETNNLCKSYFGGIENVPVCSLT